MRPGVVAEAIVDATIERELQTVTSAIRMVAAGRSPRVSVAGLHFAAELLEPARRLAAEAGVVVVPLWAADESTTALAVEPGPGLEAP
jgi:hypothetical protein